MQNLLKQSAAKGFASFDRRFSRSIFQLTLFYSIIIGVILLITASITYSAFSTRINLRYNRTQQPAAIPVIIKVSSSTDGTTTFISSFHPAQGQPGIMPSDQIGQQNAPQQSDLQPSAENGNGERRWPTAAEVREDLIKSLILVNTYLFLIAIAGSYVLARITLRPLKHAYDDQRRFIADASHELRTPLAVMKIELENQLAMGEGNGKLTLTQDDIQSHLDEVDRMSKIVQDLLLLSKLEGEPVSKKKLSEVNLAVAVQDTVKRLQAVAKKHNVTLSFAETKAMNDKGSGKHEAEVSAMIKGNEQISHILTNIIQNAIIYNKQNGSVDVSIRDEKNQAVVTVKDTGVGISTEDLMHIFDRFYRADKSRSRATGGSGLGLSIVERSVKSVGGTIEIKSELGKGTTVKISFRKA